MGRKYATSPEKHEPKDWLIRDADDWARDWGWISNRRAKNLAAKLELVAQGIDGAMNADEDEGAAYWVKEIRAVAKVLNKDAPAALRNAAAREP